MTKVFSLLFVFSVAISAFSQPGKEAEVWGRVEALNKAVFETKDSAAISELVANELSYGHSGGNVEDKATMIRNAVVNAEVYSNLTSEKLITVNAANAVVVRYILRGSSVKNGTTSALNISIMQVWAKEKGKWKLFARQAVKVNPK